MSRYTITDALKDPVALILRIPGIWAIWGGKRLDPHLREEVMIAVATSVGCRYCTFSHREIVLQSGEDLMALAEFEQVEDHDENTFAAIIWAQAKVEAGFGPVSPAIERELRSRFTDSQCRDIETVALAMKLMSSCGHEADSLVERLQGKPRPGSSLGNEMLMATLYFPPAALVGLALAKKRGSFRSMISDFRKFSANFDRGPRLRSPSGSPAARSVSSPPLPVRPR